MRWRRAFGLSAPFVLVGVLGGCGAADLAEPSGDSAEAMAACREAFPGPDTAESELTGARDGNVLQTRGYLQPAFRETFEEVFLGLDDGEYLALCVFSLDSGQELTIALAPASGNSVIVASEP